VATGVCPKAPKARRQPLPVWSAAAYVRITAGEVTIMWGGNLLRLVAEAREAERSRWCRGPQQRRAGSSIPECKSLCGTSDLGIGWGYVKQTEIVGDYRSSRRNA
jgi:hypothetical protein